MVVLRLAARPLASARSLSAAQCTTQSVQAALRLQVSRARAPSRRQRQGKGVCTRAGGDEKPDDGARARAVSRSGVGGGAPNPLAPASSSHARERLSADASPSSRDDTADAFKRELQRRGITSAQTEQLQRGAQASPGAESDARDARPRPQGRASAPPRWASDTPESLQQSRALGSEGLEGLIPRATELLRLGFGFFLPFWPFMAAFSVLFTLTYLCFGDFFLHSGSYFDPDSVLNAQQQPGLERPTARGPPPYVVPEALLAEPTVDRMVPFNSAASAQ